MIKEIIIVSVTKRNKSATQNYNTKLNTVTRTKKYFFVFYEFSSFTQIFLTHIRIEIFLIYKRICNY